MHKTTFFRVDVLSASNFVHLPFPIGNNSQCKTLHYLHGQNIVIRAAQYSKPRELFHTF
jgi:hypothetical protein